MRKIFNRFFYFMIVLFMVFLVVKKTYFYIYVARQNQVALLKIKEVNPENYLVFTDFIKDIENNTEWKVYITSTYRTAQEQEMLRKKDPRNARAGQSKHNFAKAVDFVLFKNTFLWQNWILKSSSKKRWQNSKVLEIAKRHQLEWGGTFSNYYDPVHFEIK
jgi:hypothetical protein